MRDRFGVSSEDCFYFIRIYRYVGNLTCVNNFLIFSFIFNLLRTIHSVVLVSYGLQ